MFVLVKTLAKQNGAVATWLTDTWLFRWKLWEKTKWSLCHVAYKTLVYSDRNFEKFNMATLPRGQ
jgi:hypothetical protein